MMRSLYSGVSGLRSHQTRMDVIGANIANVNTIGFKASRVTFRDVLYQTLSNATSPTDEEDGAAVRGGVNPYQIGLGSQIASIDMLNTRAGPQVTDRPLDCYIDGDGYFKVTVPNGEEDYEGDAIEYFTRVGNFSLDEQWQLVDSNGNYVMGLNAMDGELEDEFEVDDETTEIDGEKFTTRIRLDIDPDDEEKRDYTNIAINPDGMITGYNNYTGQIDTLGKVVVYKFTNPEGLFQAGNTYYQQTRNSGDPVACHPGLSGAGGIATSRLEMSNVELSKEFTDMIITQRGFQANSRVITVSDEMLQELVSLKR